jgi:hypothetical protein
MAPEHQSRLTPVPVKPPSPAESLDPAEPSPTSRVSGQALGRWLIMAICSSLIPSGRRLDYIPRVQLEFGEKSRAFRLTLAENRPGFGANNLITSGAAGII